MQIRSFISLVIAAVFLCATSVDGYAKPDAAKPRKPSAPISGETWRAYKLIGTKVMDRTGQRVYGQLNDIMFDTRTLTIKQVVIGRTLGENLRGGRGDIVNYKELTIKNKGSRDDPDWEIKIDREIVEHF